MILLRLEELILLNPAKRDKLIMINFFSGVLINIVLWAILIFNFWQSSEYVILRYNIYFGISDFGPWYKILWLPFWGAVILAINYPAAFYFYLRQRPLSYYMAAVATGVNLIMLVVAALLVYINW